MSEVNKTYRIRTQVGSEASDDYISLDANLVQDYEAFDILSVKISSSDTYRLHNANYGVVVGRVIANNGFGVPNAKLSIFIESDSSDGEKVKELYPFTASYSKDWNGVRYNLLPDEEVGDCHQIVGTFPNKRYLLDNDVVLEVFDKYYTFTTRTNNSGDYLIMGVPVGTHTLHMDLDLSDCGILSQRPRDFVYKGYTVEQFENPNKFKSGTDYENLSQVFTQDRVVNVQPFWGNESLGETIGLTRADINISFEFQPTCVFIGSVVSDKSSDGITKKCMATENMGNMEEMTTGEGTIEMIRKTPNGSIEEFQVKGTQLIDSNGVWCYQIPMNLDYMMTDEYGNMVPTDDPSKGIPTRCSARFRISMQDNEENVDNFFRAKVLVPHNPQNLPGGEHEEYDYEFGSKTRDESFRDLFWNNVYTVKSYIPRFQKRRIRGWKDKRFTGIKSCNFSGTNNPIPYNNIRIKLPLMFTILCAIIKCFIFLTGIFNTLISALGNFMAQLGRKRKIIGSLFKKAYESSLDLKLNVLSEGLCPDLENWFFAPMLKNNLKQKYTPPKGMKKYNLLSQTLEHLLSDTAYDDEKSIEYENREAEDEVMCLTINVDYLISCVEMNLAMEYKVINFDFYNDWINGLIYIPRFMRYLRPKKTFLGITFAKAKIKGCMDDTKIFSKTRRYTQQCALGYKTTNVDGNILYSNVENPLGRSKSKSAIKRANNLHKSRGFSQKTIFGKNGGICHEHTTSKKQNVYYMKPCEWTLNTSPINIKVNLFATDIVLLGSLNDCDSNGVPQAFKYLSSTSYIIPTNLALTNMETNATLYANEKGTICTGNGGQLPTDETLPDNDGIRVIPVSSGLSGEILYYSGAQDTNIEVAYEGKELSDIIALTEAAGISWDYTGPGQGEPDPKRLYYPGGHFLGLTCVNSQTNLKSCINLERICEVGANMSQRKEDIRGVDDNGIASYIYYPPTGFISGDDIVAEDFRVMFSTLNQNRLIATKINPLTGYKMYDFKYVHPINFDGSFANVVKNNDNYNAPNSGIVPTESYTVLRNAGIETNMNNRPDGDADEHAYTLTRTIESTSVDYYRFRFGLNKNDNDKLDDNLQKRKILLFKDNKYYLPQYENSFYFYFGMKPGASAMDEFNKQFFAQCETNSITMVEPDFELKIDNMNVCEGKADVVININGMETPYSKIFYTKEGDMNQIDDVYEMIVTEIDGDYKYNKSIDVPGLSFGNYTFTVIDANGLTITKNINIGGDILSADIIKHDFNVSDYNSLSGNERDVFGGGYFEINNFKIRKDNFFIPKRNARVVIKSGDYETSAITSDSLNIYVPSASVIYDIYLSYKCPGSSVWNDIYYASYTLHDGSSVTLNMGLRNLPAYLPVGSSGSTKSLIYGENKWWEKIDGKGVGEEKMKEYWLKKLCLFKENTSEETFSNNVFAINGSKVIWGTPQNENGVYKPVNGKNVFSSEDDSELYNNNTLDDDYSYFPTIPSNSGNVNYSAIAVNGTTVAGDYWAILNDSQTGWVSSQRFTNGTGYIFKPLPNGELQYHVYSGQLIYNPYILEDGTSLLDEPGENVEYEEITKGVFYPSFIYPVVSAPFKADLNFYVWEEKYVYIEEGSDIPKYGVSQNAGRTEVEITNGITYDGKFSNAYIQNIKDTDLSAAIKNAISGTPDTVIISGGTRTIELSGMSVDVSVLEETDDDNETIKPIFKDAYIANGGFLFAKGFSGITDFAYEITEGVPEELDFNGKVLSGSLINQVNSIADDIDAEIGFSESISYKIISESLISGGKQYFVKFNGNDKTKYYIQREGSKKKLLYSPSTGNNLSYIYYKRGGDKPTYDILAMYNENAEYNKKDELCFIRVKYPKERKMTYKIPYINEYGDTVYQSGEVEGKSAKNNRNNISWFIKQIGNNKKATPVQNNLIVVSGYSVNNVYRGNWADKLSGGTNTGNIDTIVGDNGIYNFSINAGDILFAVQQKSATTVNGGITNVFKIFPVVLPQAKDDNEDEIYVYSAGTVHLGEKENELTEMTKITLTADNTSSNVFSATYYSTVILDENDNIIDETEEVKRTMLTINNKDYELSEHVNSSIAFDDYEDYVLKVISKNIKSSSITEGDVIVNESAITYGLQFQAPSGIDESKLYNLTFWSKDDKNTGLSLILELLRRFVFTIAWVNNSNRTISKEEGISLLLYNNSSSLPHRTFELGKGPGQTAYDGLSPGQEYTETYSIPKTDLENANEYVLDNLNNINANIYYGDGSGHDEIRIISSINISSGYKTIDNKNAFFGITESGGFLRIVLIDRE